jgi:hypothetical protein
MCGNRIRNHITLYSQDVQTQIIAFIARPAIQFRAKKAPFAAMNGLHCAWSVAEALGNYLSWEVYHHAA